MGYSLEKDVKTTVGWSKISVLLVAIAVSDNANV